MFKRVLILFSMLLSIGIHGSGQRPQRISNIDHLPLGGQAAMCSYLQQLRRSNRPSDRQTLARLPKDAYNKLCGKKK